MRSLERFPTIRQSRLATFDRCALSASFEERYASGWSSHAQARGTIFHRVAAKALRTMYDQQERTIPTDAAIAILDEELRQQDADRECPSCSKAVVRRFAKDGFPRIVCADGHEHSSSFVNLPMSEVAELRWVVVKFANDNAFDIENLVDVEQRLRATISYAAPDGSRIERELTGALDALFVTGERDDEFIVLDWKDSWGLPGPTDVGFDGYFQQRFYAWLVFRNYPSAQRVTLREFYVRFSEPREATVFRGDMEDIEAELSALAERFDRAWEDEVFPPTPGVHCQICPRPAACPIFPGVRREGMITDEETARRIAREMAVAEAALKQRRDAMNAYTSVHGPVEVSSHKGKRGWGHKPTRRTARPTKEEMQRALAAARAGVPLDLDKLYRTSQTTRFSLMPIKEIEPSADDAALMAALEASVAGDSVPPNSTKEDAA